MLSCNNMKTIFTRFVATLVCCLTLFAACKKDDSNPTPSGSSVPSTASSYLVLNKKRYTILETQVLQDSSDNTYQCLCLAASTNDTVYSIISFQMLQPTLGTHLLNYELPPEAIIGIYDISDRHMAISNDGKCEVLKQMGKYKFVFTDIDFVDSETGTIRYKASGTILTP
jgi:hypothetical protein